MFQLKKLKPKHKDVAALLAQGVGREQIAQLVGITPEYVTMLSAQPLFQAHVQEMTKFTDLRLQAIYDKSVDVIAQTLTTGSETSKLQAARMAMRAVGKEGTVNVQGTVHHSHSLIGLLRTLPPVTRTVPNWNTSDQPNPVASQEPAKAPATQPLALPAPVPA